MAREEDRAIDRVKEYLERRGITLSKVREFWSGYLPEGGSVWLGELENSDVDWSVNKHGKTNLLLLRETQNSKSEDAIRGIAAVIGDKN